MSKKRREKQKAKIRRHGSDEQQAQGKAAPEPSQAKAKQSAAERDFLNSAPHLQQMSAAWQQFYGEVRRAAITEMQP